MGWGPVVAIDPHNFNNTELLEQRTAPESSSYQEFLANIAAAGVADFVVPRRAYSSEVAAEWKDAIRFLWIDGDHSYAGAKTDFDGFMRCVAPLGLVAFHDSLHEFAGPIRVFVEDVLRSNQFGAAGFVGSIAWSQFRPEDGTDFARQRAEVEKAAARLIPFVKGERKLRGIRKLLFKLNRARVPHGATTPEAWAALVNGRGL
jgi:hypothetical protein